MPQRLLGQNQRTHGATERLSENVGSLESPGRACFAIIPNGDLDPVRPLRARRGAAAHDKAAAMPRLARRDDLSSNLGCGDVFNRKIKVDALDRVADVASIENVGDIWQRNHDETAFEFARPCSIRARTYSKSNGFLSSMPWVLRTAMQA
jgi:hypothetical protein